MVGRPRARAKRRAAQIAAGEQPEEWTDTRPMKKPPDRELGHQLARARRGPQIGLPGVTDGRVDRPDADDTLLGQLVGQALGQLDAETSADFEEMRRMAFAHVKQVMSMDLDQESKHFAKVLQSKTVLSQAILTATTRVRPGDLREKDDDGVGALLDEVRRQEAGGEGDPDGGAADDPEHVGDAALSAEDRARIALLS